MRYFTVDEAEARIPELEKIFAAAGEIRAKAEARVAAINKLESEKSSDPARLAIERSQLEFLAGCLELALQGVEKLGAVVKGIDPALVDFPARLDGAEVYLCWTAGETRIASYHAVEDGFTGRRPLPKATSH